MRFRTRFRSRLRFFCDCWNFSDDINVKVLRTDFPPILSWWFRPKQEKLWGNNDTIFFYPLLREEYHRSVPIHVTGGTSVPCLRSSLLRAGVKVHRIFASAPRLAGVFNPISIEMTFQIPSSCCSCFQRNWDFSRLRPLRSISFLTSLFRRRERGACP